MKLKPHLFLRSVRRYLPKKEYDRVVRELDELGGGSVAVSLKRDLPKRGDAADGGVVEAVDFVLDRKLKTYVPVVYVRDRGKLRPVAWTS